MIMLLSILGELYLTLVAIILVGVVYWGIGKVVGWMG